jgi:hypothetical protein
MPCWPMSCAELPVSQHQRPIVPPKIASLPEKVCKLRPLGSPTFALGLHVPGKASPMNILNDLSDVFL